IVELHVALIPCRRQVLDAHRLEVKNLYLRAVLIDGARHRRRGKRIASGIGGAQWQPVKLHRRVVVGGPIIFKPAEILVERTVLLRQKYNVIDGLLAFAWSRRWIWVGWWRCRGYVGGVMAGAVELVGTDRMRGVC